MTRGQPSFSGVEGLSYQEMAKAMGCSMGTVMSRLHYGRKKLQQLLRGYVKTEVRHERSLFLDFEATGKVF